MNIKEKFITKGTRLICGWCKKEFYAHTEKGDHGFPVIVHCGRILPGSKKESTGNLTGRKHTHTAYKNGDIAG